VRRRGALAAGAALVAALAPAAPARAEQALVTIRGFSFEPPAITVLAGDSVAWSNRSLGTTHTVHLRDGTFDSGLIPPSRGASHAFDLPGAHPYLCTLHPFMTGSVSVERVLLRGPTAAVLAPTPVRLAGRIVPGNPSVTVEAATASGFAPVASAPVGSDGAFASMLRPDRTTTYRVVAGGIASPAVRVEVTARPRLLLRRSGGRLRVRSAPRLPGATVVLQLRLRERFGWWPVRRARLDRRGVASFALRPRSAVPARVALTRRDGVTVLALSRALGARAGGVEASGQRSAARVELSTLVSE
jgi:plastocyanin